MGAGDMTVPVMRVPTVSVGDSETPTPSNNQMAP